MGLTVPDLEPLRAAWRRGRAWSAWALGASARARSQLDGRAAVVLTYHRVLPAELAASWGVEPGMFVTPQTFRRHLEWLRDGFRVLPLVEIAERLAAGRSLPAHACALTFDDGWRDNFDHAWPALREQGLPATIFLVTGRVGTAGAFWPDEVHRRLITVGRRRARALTRAWGVPAAEAPELALLAHLKGRPEPERDALLERLRCEAPLPEGLPDRELLSWEEVETMARGDVDFESHGAQHLILTGTSPEAALADLRDARATLSARGLGRGGLLAYPSGASDPRVAALARRCGYRAAFTVGPGLFRAGADPFAYPRVGLHEDVSASAVEFRRAVPGDALRAEAVASSAASR